MKVSSTIFRLVRIEYVTRIIEFVSEGFCFVCFFPRDFHSPHWGGEGDFVLFSINQFSQPFNSEIYIHIADLLLSLLHPGTIYFFFSFHVDSFPPYFYGDLLDWFFGCRSASAHGIFRQPRTVSLSLFHLFSFMAVICVYIVFTFLSCTYIKEGDTIL